MLHPLPRRAKSPGHLPRLTAMEIRVPAIRGVVRVHRRERHRASGRIPGLSKGELGGEDVCGELY
jgi:hypothetical protein